jgi:group I intron endonuclease
MIVYLLLNTLNNKAYVGQHKGNDLAKRWTAGMRNVKPNPHFAAAIEKYGVQAFSREVLAHCRTQEETDNLERLWICALRTYDPKCGYNMQYGGLRKAARLVPEIRRKIVRQWSLEGRQKLAETIRLQWRSRTPAEIAAIGSKIRQGKQCRPSSKKGKQYGPQKNPCMKRPSKSEETKKKITEGLRKYWARKRELSQRKPVTGIAYQHPDANAGNRQPSRGIGRLNGGRYACAV